jgi:transposase
VRYGCQDIIALHMRVHEVEAEIGQRLGAHEVGKLLKTIVDVSTLTAARIIAETGVGWIPSPRFSPAMSALFRAFINPGTKDSANSPFPLVTPVSDALSGSQCWSPCD